MNNRQIMQYLNNPDDEYKSAQQNTNSGKFKQGYTKIVLQNYEYSNMLNDVDLWTLLSQMKEAVIFSPGIWNCFDILIRLVAVETSKCTNLSRKSNLLMPWE